jgi:YVTN family beta-propeller protein
MTGARVAVFPVFVVVGLLLASAAGATSARPSQVPFPSASPNALGFLAPLGLTEDAGRLTIPPVLPPLVTTIPVGTNPGFLAYDSGNNEVFVSNYGSKNVSAISDSTNSVMANIPVGSDPADLVYDRGLGEIFVANEGTDNVTVISDATDKVVANIPVGVEPIWEVYDSTMSEVFVFNSNNCGGPGCDGSASVISDASDTVVATINLGNTPEWAAYDPAVGEVFVANAFSNNVSIIADATNTVLGTVHVGHYPDAVAYDPASGEIFVANGGSGSNNVSVISDTTNKLVATVPCGVGPDALSYDSANGDVYVSAGTMTVIDGATNGVVATISIDPASLAYDSGTGNVFASGGPGPPDWLDNISGSTNTVVTSYNVGLYPYAVLYDSGAGEVFTANYGTANVSVIGDSTRPVATSFGAAPSTIQVGSSTTVSVATTGGIWPLSYAYSGLPSGCATANSAAISCTPAVVGSFTLRVYVNDSSGHSATATTSLTVTPITVTAFSATPASVVLGTTTTFAVTESGGVGTLSYYYSGLPAGCTSANTPSLPCTASRSGSYTVRVYVNDSVGNSGTSTTGLTVTPMTITSFVASPSTVQVGGSTSLSTVVKGGIGTMSYAYAGLPQGCATADLATLSCSPAVAGSYTIRVFANDSASNSANATTTLTVTPESGPSISSFSAVPSGLLLGSWTNLTVSATGGVGTLSYAYTGLPMGCLSASVAMLACEPGQIGTFTAKVFVNDTAGNSANATAVLAVFPPHFLVSFVVQPTTCGPITFNGTGQANQSSARFLPLTFAAVAASCAGYAFGGWIATGALALSGTTTLGISVQVNGPGSLSADYIANSPPSSLVASGSASSLGQFYDCLTGSEMFNFTLSGQASGGTPPYTFVWNPGYGSPPEFGQNITHTYLYTRPTGQTLPAGWLGAFAPLNVVLLWTATLNVTDQHGRAATANVSVTGVVQPTGCPVPPPPPSGGSFPLGLGTSVAIVGVVGAVIAVAVVLLVLRRKRKRDEDAPSALLHPAGPPPPST